VLKVVTRSYDLTMLASLASASNGLARIAMSDNPPSKDLLDEEIEGSDPPAIAVDANESGLSPSGPVPPGRCS
jgi:hypothetical protein